MFPFLESAKRKKELDQNGLYIGAIHNEDGLKRLAICLLRGLMVFLACYGSVVGLVEAFDIAYNRNIVTLFLLGISLFASFLYYNKPIFYIGYVVLLVGFTYELVRYYRYANSGYQAVINIIFEDYSDYFNLLTLREAHEYITDRYTTVTIAMIFVGTLLAILLNVTISGYMNLLETMLITFPFLEIAFYIDKRPPLYCIVMLLAVYICVGLQQASKHFKMTVKGRHTPEYLRFRRKKTTTYVYQSTAKGTLQTLLFSLILSGLVGLGFYTSYYSKVPIQPSNVIKETTDNYVKIFVQSGFTGLLDRYESTGGLSHGRLGGVSSIRPDFETDLTVTFAPYSYETVYLKGFTGSYYTSNQWLEHTYLDAYPQALELVPEEINVPYSSEDSAISTSTLVYMEKETIDEFDAMYQPNTDSSGKMEIDNVGADTAFYYLPYYSSTDNMTLDFGNASGSVTETPPATITYSPYLGHYDEDVEPFDLPLYYDLYVNEFCLQIPEDLRPVLEEYCVEQDFPGIASADFTDAPANPEDINAYRLEVAQAIYNHYVAEFDYTMSPGTTPYRQDFVAYFLTTQKRGVCAHFAASATMLLRSMGIPARYVEGYCIPLSAMSDGQPIQAEYSEWYKGPSQVAEEGVLSVDITDANAHAWVEIYLEGYGFVPFEMTPPDFLEDNPTNFNFGNLFDDFFSMDLSMEELSNGNNTDIEFERNELPLFSFSFGTSLAPVLVMTGSLLGVGILIVICRILFKKYKLYKLLKTEKYADLIYIRYEALCKKTAKKSGIFIANPLPDELCRQIEKMLPIPLDGQEDEKHCSDLNTLFTLTEKALYSPNGITADEYRLYEDLYSRAELIIKEYKVKKVKK